MPVMPSQNSTVVVTSAKELIQEALGLIGVYPMGEEIDAAELKDCLRSLNFMLDAWNTEILNINARNREVFNITGGTQAYTIGEGGDFDTKRPPKLIEKQVYLKDGELEWPLECLTVEQWADIFIKVTNPARPTGFYYDQAFPLGTINLWMIPDKNYQLVLYTWNQLTQISSPSQLFSMPAGYTEAIAYNLAIRLAPKYQKSTPPEVAAVANESHANFKRLNAVRPLMRVDELLEGPWYGSDFGGGGGSSMPVPDILIVNTNYLIPSFQWLVIEAYGGVDGITLTMPSAPQRSMVCTVMKMDADVDGSVTITGPGPNLDFYLTNKDQTVTFIWDGSIWVRQANN